MKTFKRRIADIDTSVNNLSKYSNQMSFTGIKEDRNIFNVDQQSQTDALNVYVDGEQCLVSREPIANVDLPIILNTGDQLIDIKETNGVKIFVVKNNNIYTITALRDSEQAAITCNNKYHISIFNQYVICFRDQGAKVLNTNNELYWDSLENNNVEIPVTKITTGSDTNEGTTNQLTNTYIHRYVRTAKLATILPEFDRLTTSLSAKIYTENGVGDYGHLSMGSSYTPGTQTFEYPEYRFMKTLPITINKDDQVLAANKTVVIAKPNYFLLSFDYGITFSKVSYPQVFTRRNGTVDFINDLQGLSDDGQDFFYVTESGVYKCNLADFKWTRYTYHDLTDEQLEAEKRNGLGIKYEEDPTLYCSRAAHFKNSEVFCFKANGRVFFKAPGMSTNDIRYNNTLSWAVVPLYKDDRENKGYPRHSNLLYQRSIKIDINELGNGYLASIEFNDPSTYSLNQDTETYFTSVVGLGTSVSAAYYGYGPTLRNDRYSKSITIEDIKYVTNYNSTTLYAIEVKGVVNRINGELDDNGLNGNGTYEYTYTMGYDTNGDTSVTNNIDKITWDRRLIRSLDYSGDGVPIKLTDNLYILYAPNARNTVLLDTFKLDELVGKYGESGLENDDFSYGDYTYQNYYYGEYYTNNNMIITNNTIYTYYNDSDFAGNNKLYTNNLAEKDRLEIDYEIRKFRDTDYPEIPDLSYSGEELYLVFNNELRVTNNVKDGSDIRFNLPKINNKPFADKITGLINISTTEIAIFFDNGITICTKNVSDNSSIAYTYDRTRLSLGVRFGDNIINTLDGANTIFATKRGLAIMNYQAYMATTDQVLSFASDDISTIWTEFYRSGKSIKILQMKNYVFISNQTDEYLMLDMRTLSWWRFKIPFEINKFLTDQVTLYMICDKLYKLDSDYDKKKYLDCDGSRIDWLIVSQRLHFGLPNHYKNLKQLIFQLVQANEFKNTINTEIKLYRKVITYKEPEIINFKIDEYRTFVKRFNYWKINEVQWGITNDKDTATPAQLILNGIDIKYEVGEEVK